MASYPITMFDFTSGAFNDSNQFDLLLKMINASKSLVCLKGYGSGFPDQAWHDEALRKLRNVKTLVFDGDWYKPDSMTSLILPFLEQSYENRVIAFRKMGNQDNLMKSWTFDSESAAIIRNQMIVVRVHDDDIEMSKLILMQIGLEESKIQHTALGFLTYKIVNASCEYMLSIGGGETCLNEITAMNLYYRQTQNIKFGKWDVMNVGRNAKNGYEEPEVVIKEAEITNSLICV